MCRDKMPFLGAVINVTRFDEKFMPPSIAAKDVDCSFSIVIAVGSSWCASCSTFEFGHCCLYVFLVLLFFRCFIFCFLSLFLFRFKL